MRVDVHQHLWTPPLVEALAARSELPFIRRSGDATLVHCAGERPSAVATSTETAEDIDLALVALSSPIGIEALPRTQALRLIEAHLEGVDAAGDRFAAWGPIPLEDARPADVDAVLQRGCAGVSLPAGAVAGVAALHNLQPVLAHIARLNVPLLIHPGPGHDSALESDPGWWPALTAYVAQMQAAWLAFVSAGRQQHPALTIVFTMLAGGAPLLGERLQLRGGPTVDLHDARIFYDTSGYGPAAVRAVASLVGREQLVYGSDRPVVDPPVTEWDAALQAQAAALLRLRERAVMSLSARELKRFVAELLAHPARWAPHVRHSHDVRVYEQIWDDDQVNAWVICWSEEQDTGFHDHDVSAAAIAVVAGRVREERLRVDGQPLSLEHRAGSVFTVPPVAIHRMRHAGSGPAVTLHAYSPPLSRTGAYRTGADGVLQREALPMGQELRPQAALL